MTLGLNSTQGPILHYIHYMVLSGPMALEYAPRLPRHLKRVAFDFFNYKCVFSTHQPHFGEIMSTNLCTCLNKKPHSAPQMPKIYKKIHPKMLPKRLKSLVRTASHLNKQEKKFKKGNCFSISFFKHVKTDLLYMSC